MFSPKKDCLDLKTKIEEKIQENFTFEADQNETCIYSGNLSRLPTLKDISKFLIVLFDSITAILFWVRTWPRI